MGRGMMVTLESYPLPVEEMGAQKGCIALHRRLSSGVQPCVAQLFSWATLGQVKETWKGERRAHFP